MQLQRQNRLRFLEQGYDVQFRILHYIFNEHLEDVKSEGSKHKEIIRRKQC